MKEYVVIYEPAESNWGAYSPDVPGCIATGKTLDDVRKMFQEALEFHLDGLKKEGLPIPEAQTEVGRVAVAI